MPKVQPPELKKFMDKKLNGKARATPPRRLAARADAAFIRPGFTACARLVRYALGGPEDPRTRSLAAVLHARPQCTST